MIATLLYTTMANSTSSEDANDVDGQTSSIWPLLRECAPFVAFQLVAFVLAAKLYFKVTTGSLSAHYRSLSSRSGSLFSTWKDQAYQVRFEEKIPF